VPVVRRVWPPASTGVEDHISGDMVSQSADVRVDFTIVLVFASEPSAREGGDDCE
jgi:hypothetical protein